MNVRPNQSVPTSGARRCSSAWTPNIVWSHCTASWLALDAYVGAIAWTANIVLPKMATGWLTAGAGKAEAASGLSHTT
jgi:hypothetical protein